MTLPIITLNPVQPALTIGDQPGNFQPNVIESCILADPNGTAVGLFLKELPDDLRNLVNIADRECISDRVPKTAMVRASGVTQYSCILGSVPPKPHLRRPYGSRSSVHSKPSAKTFVRAMNAAGERAFRLCAELVPTVTQHHVAKVNERIPLKWRFADHFSSTISNCNIAAAIHRDNANVKGAINIIITKRRNSTGGNLHVPDYDATFDMTDNSLLVYPAWRNSHGVTPIVPTHQGGYRNSHVWYALDSFHGLK